MTFCFTRRFHLAYALLTLTVISNETLAGIQEWFAPPRPPHPAVVRISVPEGRAFSLGSGTLVDVHDRHGLVLTNWHVVREAKGDIGIEFADGHRVAARVLHSDEKWDLAALLISGPLHAPPMSLASSPPQPGDTLTIAGYGPGPYREATGHCTQYVAPGNTTEFEMVEVSVRARQGDSGGPIMDADGQLAGVLFGSTRRATSGSHVGRVRAFLAEIRPDQLPRQVRQSTATQPVVQPPARPPSPKMLAKSPPTAREQPLARAAKLVPTSPQSAWSTGATPRPAPGLKESAGQPPPVRAAAVREIPRVSPVSSEPNPRHSPAADSLSLDQLVGRGTWNHVKTLFALIGVFATFRHFSQREREK